MDTDRVKRSEWTARRPRPSRPLIGPTLVLGLLMLVVIASPRCAAAQGTDSGAKAPTLWTDPKTDQVFTKPGPGRVPFNPAAAPVNEQPNSEIHGLQQETHEIREQLKALTNKDGIQYGGVNVKLGGFIENAGIYRTRNEVADVGSDYNQGIPFNNNPLAHENETRFSARQSRLSLLITGNVNPETHLGAYYEMDFLSSGTNSNSRESNSYTPRSRQLYATLDKDNWGLHVLAGQAWSLMTTNTVGIIPRKEQIPLTIDAQYVEGFNWLRVPQFRVVEDFGHGVWAGLSAESPETVTSPITAPSSGNYVNNGDSAGLLNNSTTYSNNWLPDFDGKIAVDPAPGWGHYEFKSLVRTFTAREGGANRNATGWGVGGAAAMAIVPTYVDLQLSGLYGDGIGRYGSGQLPDAAFEDDLIHLTAVSEAQGLVGIIGHPWAGNDLYLYGGWEHADRAGSSTIFTNSSGAFAGAPGYGSPNLNVSGCNQLSGTCQAETRDLQQITAGFWQDIYKGSFGRFVGGFQGGQIWRTGFSGTGGNTPRTNIAIFMISLRYYPFS